MIHCRIIQCLAFSGRSSHDSGARSPRQNYWVMTSFAKQFSQAASPIDERPAGTADHESRHIREHSLAPIPCTHSKSSSIVARLKMLTILLFALLHSDLFYPPPVTWIPFWINLHCLTVRRQQNRSIRLAFIAGAFPPLWSGAFWNRT